MSRCKPDIVKVLSRGEGAYSQNTLQGYRKDLECFKRWCEQEGAEWLPAQADLVAGYVDQLSDHMSIATVKRRLCAIRFAHHIADLSNPIAHSDVQLAVRRAFLRKRRRPAQSLGLTGNILQKILAACGDDLIGMRDAALIATGYDTLCRSSELAAMRAEHVSFTDGETSIFIPLSKSDPFGDGRISYLSPRTTMLLKLWLQSASIQNGAVFRGLRSGRIGGSPLCTSSIRRLVKAASRRANLPSAMIESLSGHSMRIGAAQDMLTAGFDQLAIMQAGGWKTPHVVLRYIENAATQSLHQLRWQRLGFDPGLQ